MEHFLPLMANNITRQDLDKLIDFLRGEPRLTQSENVRRFEEEWSKWLGVKHSVFLNSGASANLISMAAVRHFMGEGEVIVPALTWVSDVAAVLQNGLKPVFVDINMNNLCMDTEQVISKINDKTRAVFLTHAQGFNGINQDLLAELEVKGVALVEDVCEAHGATYGGKKCGSFGLISNFSFYFAHHMTTIEGGMACTDDDDIYQFLRMYRSHGMVREMDSEKHRKKYHVDYPDLSPDFIFAYPAYNLRNTEIGGVLGLSQLDRLDSNNSKRRNNFKIFLDNLDSDKYYTDFDIEGSCNYAFNLILKHPDEVLRDRLEKCMSAAGVEFRRGSAGGGNQMRQPYLREIVRPKEWEQYLNVEHVHFYGYYLGNYPDLSSEKIRQLCRIINNV